MFILVAAIFPLIASSGLKIEEVIAHETIQKKQEITIEENLHGGKVLVLNDGSTWEIAPQDLNTSQSWIFPSPLKIEKSSNSSYPYRIINTNSNSSVLARPISTNTQ
ncbi:MAG: hypothetical protein KFB93_03795 [Simkaniaceae bacterium]|jgi:hypothetical protein|nr:MAG: hypothetical protein KFB93_03795 [Simkaniaceae bacterium]